MSINLRRENVTPLTTTLSSSNRGNGTPTVLKTSNAGNIKFDPLGTPGAKRIGESAGSEEEKFYPPTQVISDDPKIDLKAFENLRTISNRLELTRQSLYTKFDPLLTESPQPTSQIKEQIPSPVRQPFKLDFELSSAKPVSEEKSVPKQKMYTEEELQARIREALEQQRGPQNAGDITSRLLAEIEELKNALRVEEENNKEMTAVVEEYGRTMSRMIETAEKQDQGSNELVVSLQKDKDQLETDLKKTESAFSDLHRKYEKAKEINENLKRNEMVLRTALEKAQVALKQSEERYEALKSHAEKKIEEANHEIANVRESYKQQIQLLTTKVKKAETEASHVKRHLEVREKDNTELTAICDDLVNQLETLTKLK